MDAISREKGGQGGKLCFPLSFVESFKWYSCSNFIRSMPSLPTELIENICLSAPTPEDSLRLCAALRYVHLYKYILPRCKFADMFNLSRKGQKEGLQWWKCSGLPLKYSTHAMDYASEKGHVHVLQWWKDSGLQLLYTRYAIDWACYHGTIASLD